MLIRSLLLGLFVLLFFGNSASSSPSSHQLSQQNVQLLLRNTPQAGYKLFVPGYLPEGYRLNLFEFHVFPVATDYFTQYVLFYRRASLKSSEISPSVSFRVDIHLQGNATCNPVKQQVKIYQSRLLGPVKTCIEKVEDMKTHHIRYWYVYGLADNFFITAKVTSLEDIKLIIENIIDLKRI